MARPARSVNVLAMIDIATGLSIDPPTACIPRKAISHPSDGARLQANDPSENAAKPDLEDPAAAEAVRQASPTA